MGDMSAEQVAKQIGVSVKEAEKMIKENMEIKEEAKNITDKTIKFLNNIFDKAEVVTSNLNTIIENIDENVIEYIKTENTIYIDELLKTFDEAFKDIKEIFTNCKSIINNEKKLIDMIKESKKATEKLLKNHLNYFIIWAKNEEDEGIKGTFLIEPLKIIKKILKGE